MVRNKKGARVERELVNRLEAEGWFAIRTGASGSGTESALPDVHAGDGNVTLAIEAKSSSGDPIYVGADPDYNSGDEVRSLRHFATAFRAIPLIGARFDREAWAFFHPDELHHTGSSVRVKKEDTGYAIEELHEIEDLIQGVFDGG